MSIQRKGLVMVSVCTISILIAILFRTVLPASLRWGDISDYQNYYEPVARNIVIGKGIVDSNGQLATAQAIGFPLILASIFQLSNITKVSEQTLLTVLILVCNGLTSAIVYLIARRLWKVLDSITICLIWATYPLYLWFAQVPTSEAPFMVFLYLGVFLLFKKLGDLNKPQMPTLFLSGLALGIAALIRPIALGLIVIIPIVLLFGAKRSQIKHYLSIGLFVLGFGLSVGWWIGTIYSVKGVFIPIADSGTGISLGGAVYALDRNFDQSMVPADLLEFQHDILSLAPKTLPELASILLTEFRNRPIIVTHYIIVKLLRSWYGTYSGKYEILSILIQLPYIALSILSIIQAWKTKKTTVRIFVFFSLVTVALVWAMSTIVVSQVRYTAPIMALFFIFIPALYRHPQLPEPRDN